MEIKVLRLKDGYDVISEITMIEEFSVLQLDNPMIIVQQGNGMKLHVSLMHWLPMEIIEQNRAVIDMGHVVCIMTPNETLLSYYKESVEKLDAAKNSEPIEPSEMDQVQDALDEIYNRGATIN